MSGFQIPQLTYGITPPKASYAADRREAVATAQAHRIQALPIDALVVYDLQNESSRTDAERPFPFLETIPPLEYAARDLASIRVPKIIYCSVANRDESRLSNFLSTVAGSGDATVLVGAPSRHQKTQTSLNEAYALSKRVVPDLTIGGVLIPERHASGTPDEHLRVLQKIARGCRFFITQAVFSVPASKDILSDLYYRCESLEVAVPPVLLTLSPCGSAKTLEFMRWLGISVPRWIENELVHAHDILDRSVQLSLNGFAELYDFARDKGINLGCNVESVSLRKSEIDASVEMIHRVAEIMGRR